MFNHKIPPGKIAVLLFLEAALATLLSSVVIHGCRVLNCSDTVRSLTFLPVVAVCVAVQGELLQLWRQYRSITLVVAALSYLSCLTWFL